MVQTYIMVLDSFVQFFDMKEWVPVRKPYETYIFYFLFVFFTIKSSRKIILSPNLILMYSANVKDSENADRWLAILSFSIVQ